ncbi:MAG TPA: LETM1 domain-containing protein [Cyclobacteriaceae bacterium]|nr:LETM1 domain-containing protein [Cyclobacteriaceae bacterium]HRW97987.1 LETM1 domain-containing protein [Cyclobacteriaceae bacterium]
MKPREKGWLKEYLDFRKDLLGELTTEKRRSSHPEHSLYRVIQPTGLMYGHAVEVIDHPNREDWDEKDKMKILLAESLISSSLLFHDKPVRDPEELSKLMSKTLDSIAKFYNNVFPELATSSKTFFGKRKSPLELAEKILDKRIERTSEYSGNFWTQFFHNSLLFLDIFIFGQWIHTNADRIVSDFFKYEKEELRFSVVKIIAAAAHANTKIEFEERRLLEFFLQSAGLSPEKKREALEIFEKGIEIEEINLPTNNSWLLKKYFLEMAILTIWADKKVEDVENRFLERFNQSLEFHEDDLENSMIAIEGFVLEHWEELGYLQNRQDYNEVSEKFMRRLSKLAETHKTRIISEVRDSKKLMELLRKAKSNELSEEEKHQVQEMMFVVLKTIPTFVIISLPQRFLTLPVLMKILPTNIFSESLEG